MTTSPEPTVPPPDDPAPPRPAEPAWREFARALLVPVALAVAAGLVADRYLPLPLDAELAAAVGGLVAWVVALRPAAGPRGRRPLGLLSPGWRPPATTPMSAVSTRTISAIPPARPRSWRRSAG